MKVTLLALVIVWMGAGQALSQSNLIRIRAGHDISDEFPKKLRYRFDQFQEGKIIYVNGKISGRHHFNYDLLLESMLNIQPSGDTVVVVEQPDYKYFLIREDTLFRAEGAEYYVTVLSGSKVAKLAMRETFMVKRRDKKSDDGYSSTVDQTNSVRSLRNMGYGRMIYDQDMLMAKVTQYFLVDRDGILHHANKSKFLKVFPGKKEAIENYVDKNATNFKSQEDLMRLFAYCIR